MFHWVNRASLFLLLLATSLSYAQSFENYEAVRIERMGSGGHGGPGGSGGHPPHNPAPPGPTPAPPTPPPRPGPPAPPTPTENCLGTLNYIIDTSETGFALIMGQGPANSPQACNDWCVSIRAGYCEYIGNNGRAECDAWPVNTQMLSYPNGFTSTIYSGQCH